MRKSQELSALIIKHLTGQRPADDDIMYIASLLEEYAQAEINKWANAANLENIMKKSYKPKEPKSTEPIQVTIGGQTVEIKRTQAISRRA
jgi:hypothetical protein